MKRVLALWMCLVLLFMLTACGGSETPAGNDSDEGGAAPAAAAEEVSAYSVAAVELFFDSIGVELSAVEPDWAWKLKSNYSAYGDSVDSSYGHGVIRFTKEEGELTQEEYDAWLEKVFSATAAVSQDGYNIIGYEFMGEGENALAETTLEKAMEGFLSGWGFRYNGKNMAVYVSREYDKEKESTLGSLFYYDSVQVDIGYGLQKDFDEYLGDMEEYLG